MIGINTKRTGIKIVQAKESYQARKMKDIVFKLIRKERCQFEKKPAQEQLQCQPFEKTGLSESKGILQQTPVPMEFLRM